MFQHLISPVSVMNIRLSLISEPPISADWRGRSPLFCWIRLRIKLFANIRFLQSNLIFFYVHSRARANYWSNKITEIRNKKFLPMSIFKTRVMSLENGNSDVTLFRYRQRWASYFYQVAALLFFHYWKKKLATSNPLFVFPCNGSATVTSYCYLKYNEIVTCYYKK
jgi:hypothetical protein